MNEEEVKSEQARKALLDECESIITQSKTRAAEEARAWALIERNELWREAGEKDFAEYKKKRGFSPSYVSRVLRLGRLILDANVPKGLEPAETAVRPLLKACYDGTTQVALYREACKRRKEINSEQDAGDEKQPLSPELSGANDDGKGRENIASSDNHGDTDASSTNADDDVPEEPSTAQAGKTVAMVPETEKSIDVVPLASDIRTVLKKFRANSADEIFLTSIEVKVKVDADFVKNVLETYSDRIRSVRLLSEVVKQFKSKAKMFDATTTKRIREFAIKKQKNELKELADAMDGAPDSNSAEEEVEE